MQFFHQCILELQQHEPEFWQLRVVEYIHDVIHSRIGHEILLNIKSKDGTTSESIDKWGGDDGHHGGLAMCSSAPIENVEQRQEMLVRERIAQVHESAEYASTVERIYRAIRDEMLRLSSLLDDATSDANQHAAASRIHFLQRLWDRMAESLNRDVISRQQRCGSEMHDDTVSCSYEAISFDDLHDECGSANRCDLRYGHTSVRCLKYASYQPQSFVLLCSGPFYEDIPSITMRLQHIDLRERRAALESLLEVRNPLGNVY